MLRSIPKSLIFLLLFLNSVAYADQYICTTDPIYQQYSAGNLKSLEGATYYSVYDTCYNNCRSYQRCVQEDNASKGYYCPPKRYENLGGDIGGTNFSNIDNCNAVCFTQNDCIRISYSGCRVVDIQLTDPVTDYTNKTVYTKRKITYICETNETKQIGCNKWESVSINSNLDYNTSGVGTVWKKYKGYQEASAAAYITEQAMHIFSGWAGYCEHGWLWSNPFSDPMTILSYVMMTYSAAGESALGDSAKNLHDSIESKFNSLADKFSFSDPDSLAANELNAATTPIEHLTAIPDQSSILDRLKELNTITTIDTGTELFGKVSILYTDILQIGLAALPTDDEFQSAYNFTNAWMGNTDTADDRALAYAQCMASIGLSLPNLVSIEAADINNTSDELRDPTQNPISLTKSQIAILMNATSPNYVKNFYLPIDYTDDPTPTVTYIAADSRAYFQAGQVLCAGKLAVANNIIAESQNSNDNSSNTGQNMGMAAIKMALSKMMPPYNILASVIFDVITSFSKGDACHDLSVASKWGLDQLKTNRALNFDQCHHAGSECAAKWFWGSCMREREKYCCYDQITTRIFAEGLKAQMYPETDPNTGQPNQAMWANCNDISINDLKNLSFRECEDGETPYKDKCMPQSSYNEFVNAMQKQGYKNMDITSIASQAINSLAIPNKSCNAAH